MKKNNNNEILFFQYCNQFLNNYLINRGMSTHTHHSYRDCLVLFRHFIYEKCQISCGKLLFSQITIELLMSFRNWLVESRKNSNKSVNIRICQLKSYVEFAYSLNVCLFDVYHAFSSLKPLRTEEKEKYVLSPEQVESIISQARNTKIGFRNRLILLLLYETACRVSEIAYLKVQNVNITDGVNSILVEGKGKKQRVISISDNLAESLRKYIIMFHSVTSGNEYLFYTAIKGHIEKISTRSIQTFLANYARSARNKVDSSIPEYCHPHMLRRSKATNMYQNKVPLEVVSCLLGHENLETTRIYAKPSMEMIKDAINQGQAKELSQEVEVEGNEDILARFFGL